MIPQLEQFQSWTVNGSPVGLSLLTVASSWVLSSFLQAALKTNFRLFPSVLTLAIRFALPKGIAKLAWLQKPLTKSRAERMQIAWLFATLLTGSFFLFTMANLSFSIMGNRLASSKDVGEAVDGAVNDAQNIALGHIAKQIFDGYIIASRYVSELTGCLALSMH